MKKLFLLSVIMIVCIIDAPGQSNVEHTPNFKFRTIKKGYTGDWAGSQRDTTANSGLNYNALMDEILWSMIFTSTYSVNQTLKDSVLNGGRLQLHTIVAGDSVFGRIFVRDTDTTLVFWNGEWKVIKDLR